MGNRVRELGQVFRVTGLEHASFLPRQDRARKEEKDSVRSGLGNIFLCGFCPLS
jgi:hypothetical protein